MGNNGKKRPSTRAGRRAKTVATIPAKFEPQFWAATDQRQSTIKEIKKRIERLAEDTAADTYGRDLLVQRAVFVALQLETMEVNAIETGEINAGVYTQMVNSLLGLLKTLGLDRKAKDIPSLKKYVEGSNQ